MPIPNQMIQTSTIEGEPINVYARFAINGALIGRDDIVDWGLAIFDNTGPTPATPIYLATGLDPILVFLDGLEYGEIDGGHNFHHVIDEATYFPNGQRGGATYQIEYTVHTLIPEAATKVLLIRDRIIATKSS